MPSDYVMGCTILSRLLGKDEIETTVPRDCFLSGDFPSEPTEPARATQALLKPTRICPALLSQPVRSQVAEKTPISDSCAVGVVGGIGPKSLVRVADYTTIKWIALDRSQTGVCYAKRLAFRLPEFVNCRNSI